MRLVYQAGLAIMKKLQPLLDSLLFIGFTVFLLALTMLSASGLNLLLG